MPSCRSRSWAHEQFGAVWNYAWWWLLAGALVGIGIAVLLSLGVLIVVLAGVLAVVEARMTALRNRSALAVPAVLYLAWGNRGGPGSVCETTGASTTCTEPMSPWPFLTVAAILIAVSAGLARRRR